MRRVDVLTPLVAVGPISAAAVGCRPAIIAGAATFGNAVGSAFSVVVRNAA